VQMKAIPLLFEVGRHSVRFRDLERLLNDYISPK